MASGIVIDGGMATQLQRIGYPAEKDPLFGSGLLLSHPEVILQVHQSYLESGANVVTTATYQANVEFLVENLGITVDKARELLMGSVTIARRACQTFSERNPDKCALAPVVAGSVGPYGACLRDGSEYTGSYISSVGEERLMDWHRPRMRCLVEAGVDMLAVETIPSSAEALAVLRLLREFPTTRAWISFSCGDGSRVSDGEPLSTAISRCLRADQDRRLVAVGINCIHPDHVIPLLRSCGQPTEDIPFVVYPNGGEHWDPDSKSWMSETRASGVTEATPRWVELGAGLVGGCCRMFPEDVAKMAEAVSTVPKHW